MDFEVDDVRLVSSEMLFPSRNSEDLDVSGVEVGVDEDAEAVALGRPSSGGGGCPSGVCLFWRGGSRKRLRSESEEKERFWLGERWPLAFRSLFSPSLPTLCFSISISGPLNRNSLGLGNAGDRVPLWRRGHRGRNGGGRDDVADQGL